MNNAEYSKLRDSELNSSMRHSEFNANQDTEQNQNPFKGEEEKKQQPSGKDAAAGGAGAGTGGAKFECNICLDIAHEPVVSSCGHLYCWICIYQWMNQPKETLLCPVCKSGISAETLIPIYTKGSNEDPRKKQDESIPKRPAGQRQGPIPNQNYSQNGSGGVFGNRGANGGFVMGIGLFPALFTLNFTWDDIFGSNNMNGGAGANAANSEESREQQLQRLLLVFFLFMFMSFIFFGGDVFLTF